MEDLNDYNNFINSHKRKFDELNNNNNNSNNISTTETTVVESSNNENVQTSSAISTTSTISPTTTITTTNASTSPPLTTPPKKVKEDILSLPYNITTLNWDINHMENKEKCYCYCGKDKENIMLNCDICKQRFHLRCIRLLDGSEQLYGDWVYRFSCSVCTRGNESFERFSKNYVDILEITLFNLQFRKEEKQLLFDTEIQDEKSQLGWGSSYFSLEDEILPFIDHNWNLLCSDKKKKPHWQKPLQQALQSGRIFKSGQINANKPGCYALGTDILLLKDNSVFKDKVLAHLPKKNKKKKKSQQDIQQEERDKYLTIILLTPNKEPTFIPGIEYDILCLARQNSAPQVRILDDLMTVRNDKGYRTVRSSFPVVTGEWYFEIELLDDVGNVRLGWSTFRSDVQANVGYDQFGYSYRNSQGDIFHKAQSQSYFEPYASRDVIGFYIKLPVINNVTTQEEINFPFINQISIIDMFLNEQQQDINNYPTLGDQSEIRFFKNGQSPGVAFKNLSKGMYYPSASLYLGAGVKFNFGPNFKYPPQNLTFKPYCDLLKKSIK
ncbi:hypothetical protein DLAC_07181 [Tieghemostelium lacteum]|uniref:B30.2/SPRY domain-containing protein n=1 Tax=Tieghemostelium lacteum TaxID=361077 RepID=A0A151ZDD3_TIELA|nr:hypothetical protein DLAC_07181 [Tieghemostelium lacteum]|eukprot:KYQ91941.1 hypothetical protein DLAC_07181 [Tieghemostelium lacteum]